jgi:hypothetical protein
MPPTPQKRLEVMQAISTLTAPREQEAGRRRDNAAKVARELEKLQRDCELLQQAFDEACREAALVIARSQARKRALARANTARNDLAIVRGMTEPSSAMLKASVDDPQHPGWPADTPSGLGGKFRPKDGDGAVQPRVRLAANELYPPPPPGYDPQTWKQGQWPNNNYFLEDPDGNKYTAHPEDESHWRHWDKRDSDNNDQGRWPPNSKKLKSNQTKPKADQSLTDPNGNVPPWQPLPILPVMPVDPILPIPELLPWPVFVPP